MLFLINPDNCYMKPDYGLLIYKYKRSLPFSYFPFYILDTDDLVVESITGSKLLKLLAEGRINIENVELVNESNSDDTKPSYIRLADAIDLLDDRLSNRLIYSNKYVTVKPYLNDGNSIIEFKVCKKKYNICMDYDYRLFADINDDDLGTFDFNHTLSLNNTPLAKVVVPCDGYIDSADYSFGVIYAFRLGEHIFIRFGLDVKSMWVAFLFTLIFVIVGNFEDSFIFCNDILPGTKLVDLLPDSKRIGTAGVKYKTLKQYNKY